MSIQTFCHYIVCVCLLTIMHAPYFMISLWNAMWHWWFSAGMFKLFLHWIIILLLVSWVVRQHHTNILFVFVRWVVAFQINFWSDFKWGIFVLVCVEYVYSADKLYLFIVISDLFCSELVICLIHCSHLVLFVQFCQHWFYGFPIKVVWVLCCILHTFLISGGVGYHTCLINHRHLLRINQPVFLWI